MAMSLNTGVEYPGTLRVLDGRPAVEIKGRKSSTTVQVAKSDLGGGKFLHEDEVIVRVVESRESRGGRTVYSGTLVGFVGSLDEVQAARQERQAAHAAWLSRDAALKAEQARLKAVKEAVKAFAAGTGAAPRQVKVSAQAALGFSAQSALKEGRSEFSVQVAANSREFRDLHAPGKILVREGRTFIATPTLQGDELVLEVAEVTGATFSATTSLNVSGMAFRADATYTVVGAGVEVVTRPWSKQDLGQVDGKKARAFIRAGASVTRTARGSTVITELTLATTLQGVAIQVRAHSTAQARLVGEVLDEVRSTRTVRTWEGETLSADERHLRPAGYVDRKVSGAMHLVRFPSGLVQWIGQDDHAALSARVLAGDADAIARVVTPPQIAGALPYQG